MAGRRDYGAELRRRNALAREAGYGSYYELRQARARQAHPGISRRDAAGHGSETERSERQAGDRSQRELLALLGDLPKGSIVAFTGQDRQPDGTWHKARFDVLTPDGKERSYTFDRSQLGRLSVIRDAVNASGATVIGASYLDDLADHAAEQDALAWGDIDEEPEEEEA